MIENLPEKVFITGGAGFIGSHLVDRLLTEGHQVTVYDNFSTGQRRYLEDAQKYETFRLVEGDLLDADKVLQAMSDSEFVYHLAANADIRFGLEHPRRDLEQNTLATFNVLEGMRAASIKGIVFSSTSAALGEPTIFPTPEDVSIPVQTSLYGASKMACEGLISAYCEGFGMEGYIFRFVSLLGERYPHGHVFDFCKQLFETPDALRILGDGKQRKSYLHVRDCVQAMVHVVAQQTALDAPHRAQIYHLGSESYCELNDSIGWICDQLGLAPKRTYTGGERGWVGDSPFVFLNISKLQATGWTPTCSIEDAVRCTVDWLRDNRWIFDARRGHQ